jgi:hypothetical protein
MPDPQQYDLSTAAQDPGFLAASMGDKTAFLSAHDPDFAKASPQDQAGYINHLLGNDQQDAPAPSSTYDKLTSTNFDSNTDSTSAPMRFLKAAGGALINTPKSILDTVLHPIDAAKAVGQSAAAWANPETRPTWEGIKSVLPEALGAGVGGAAGGEVLGAGVRNVPGASAAGKVASDAAGKLYQSALKPSLAGSNVAKIPGFIKTGLENQIPVSAAGLEKLSDLVDDLNTKIKSQIDAGSQAGQTVNKYAVASRLGDTAKQFANQVNPNADLATISDAGNEFLGNQPTNIPASDAQALKQGTYQQLKSRSYGELSSAAVESQKALARGLKEELQNQFPEIKDLNAQEGQLIGLDGALQKAVARISNHQLMGIGTPIAAAAGKAITGSGPLGFAAGVLKSIVDDPAVKSRLANVLYRASKGTIPLPEGLGRITAFSGALGKASSASDMPIGIQPQPALAGQVATGGQDSQDDSATPKPDNGPISSLMEYSPIQARQAFENPLVQHAINVLNPNAATALIRKYGLTDTRKYFRGANG